MTLKSDILKKYTDFSNSHFAVFDCLIPTLNKYRLFIKLLLMKKGTIEHMTFLVHRLSF